MVNKCGKKQDILYVAMQHVLQWRGERYDGTGTRTGPLQSKKLKIELKDNAKKINKNISYHNCFGNLRRRCVRSGCKTANMYRAYRPKA